MCKMYAKPVFKGQNYSDGTSYKGEALHGLRHGKGKQTFVDGSVYIGTFSRGLADGHGVLLYPDGTEYVGEFTRGKFNGIGKATLANGDSIAGHFVDAKVQGHGIYTESTTGEKHEGVFENGKLQPLATQSNLLDEIDGFVSEVQELIEEWRSELL
ncbi:uncharacterized protein LOC143460558 [Clavelina lepadiformis]|uniref:MORN repeat-containing protein 4 n=1 Tax=Clavelina lepadiformis TaxID=159417 RepID=A0ABP0GAT4_CLALP